MRKAADLGAFAADSPTGPLSDAVQLIQYDHERQFEVCDGLETLVSASEAEPIAEWAASLLSFLTKELPLHVKDEELDLFPRLAARQPAAGSNLGEILDLLVTEHETDKGLADLLVQDLRIIASGASPEYPMRFQMNVRAFCEMQRRHLNWENRVVLPLAEELLTEDDKRDLARSMLARRSGRELP